MLYYDGANLNAILGKVKPGAMGFDVIHINLHKTFSTPHGGGGPGAGPVGVAPHLLPFLPIPMVARERDGYRWLDERDRPQSIGRLSAHMGNAGVLLRAYVYARMLGREGMPRVAEFATLNANYVMAELQRAGFDVAYPQLMQGRNDEAIERIHANKALASGDPAAMINLAAAYARKGMNREALECYETAIASRDRFELQMSDGQWMDSRRAARMGAARLERSADLAAR